MGSQSWVTRPLNQRSVFEPPFGAAAKTVIQEEITVVGRIALDADSSSAGSIKLNEASMILEMSRAMGSGKRVPLRFDTNVRVRGARKGVQGAGFFPGAIVALKGRNGGGGWFLVTEILSVSCDASPQCIRG